MREAGVEQEITEALSWALLPDGTVREFSAVQELQPALHGPLESLAGAPAAGSLRASCQGKGALGPFICQQCKDNGTFKETLSF